MKQSVSDMERLIISHNSLRMSQFLPDLTKLISLHSDLLNNPKGNPLKYSDALDSLPILSTSSISLDQNVVSVGTGNQISEETTALIHVNLMQLAPWRKGPFEIFGISLDSEWQSWIKWNRFIDKITPLRGRKILDIGSSNGYYMFRMAAHKPKMVLGLEPQYAFYFQYLALQKYLRLDNIFTLPIPFDELPALTGYFDTVFCMGVLYHRKSPIDMLKKIHEIMRPGGELILENLIIESDDDICLVPEDRYAKMRNIFFIPTIKVLSSWLKRTGFDDIKCLDISKTENQEQRKTKWIQTESLTDFLDPDDPSKTVEGYPAPIRAVISARSSG